jgi:WD40 repeat protein
VWNVTSGRPLTPLLHSRAWIHYASFSADGRWVVTAGWDRTARVWNATTGVLITVLATPNGCNHATFSPDGRRVAATSEDRTVHVFDVATAQPLTSPLRHRNRATEAWFSPDGRRVATCSDDGTARVWSAETGEPLTPPLAHSAAVRHVALSADGRRVLTASDDDAVRVWDTAGSAVPLPPILPARFIWHLLALSPDGRSFTTVSSEAVAEVWDLATGRRIGPPLEHRKGVNQATFAPDGRRVVTASDDHTAQIWEFAAMPGSEGAARKVTTPLRHRAEVLGATFSPDGRRVVTASADGTARIWDAGTGRPIGPALKHAKKVRQAVFSPDGRRVATASADQTARVWEFATGRPLTPPMKHNQSVWAVFFSPDGRRVITSTADGTAPQASLSSSNSARVRVWDAQTGRALTPPLPGTYGSFSPDGSRIVGTGYARGIAWVRDAQTGRPVIPPLRHDHGVIHAAFSPDGRRVATTSLDYTARVWDAETGEPVTPPLRQDWRVEYAVFTPDGRRLITTSGQDRVWIWDLPREDRPVSDLLLVAELLTGRRVDAAGGAEPLSSRDLRRAWERLRPRYPDLFAVTPGEIWTWEWRGMEDAFKTRRWSAVRLHANRLIQDGPSRPAHWLERAHASAELGEYRRARDDYAAAIRQGADSALWAWWPSALACLAAGDLPRYRSTCTVMLDRFQRSDHPNILNDLAFTSALAPDALADRRRLVRMAERVVAAERAFWARQTLGVTLYRAGEYAGAVQRLRESISLGPRGGTMVDWLFLAMAYARLGDRTEARRWLAKAEQERARTMTPQRGEVSPVSQGWEERTIHTLLLREARQVVGGR